MTTQLRLELQVLRALAVLSVVVYHLYPNLLPTGLLGVDVFFVLSGYLITSLIWRDFESAKGKALLGQLGRFWARRARRLLPAALLVLVTTFLAGLWLGPRTWWLDSSGSFFASGAYVANWYFGFEATDYLRADAAVSPYQHFWSLSVEEQFYVLWPLLVIGVIASSIRKKLNTTIWIMVALTIASFVFAIYSSYTDPLFAFYNTFTRIWEFGFGAVLALVQFRAKPSLPKKFFGLSWLLLAVSMFIPHTQQTLLWQTLIAVGLTVAVIIVSEKKLAEKRWQPLHWVGDYSYGIYLWHWPVLILAPWVIGSSALSASWFEQIGLLILTLLLAWLSKNLIEDPIRFGAFSKLRNSLQISLLLGITVAILLSFAQIESNVRASASQPITVVTEEEEEVAPYTPSLTELVNDKPEVEEGDYVVRLNKPGFIVSEFGDVESDISIALIGDSHARQYFDPMLALANRLNFRLDVISKTACTVQDPSDYQLEGEGGYLYCKEWNQQLSDHLAKTRYDLLITSNSTLIHDGKRAPTRSFVSAVKSWQNYGQEVLVIRDNPKPNVKDEVSDFRYCIEQYPLEAGEKCGTAFEYAMRSIDTFYTESVKLPGVMGRDLTDVYCQGDWCPAVIDRVIVYRDGSHLSATFAKTLEDELEQALREAVAFID